MSRRSERIIRSEVRRALREAAGLPDGHHDELDLFLRREGDTNAYGEREYRGYAFHLDQMGPETTFVIAGLPGSSETSTFGAPAYAVVEGDGFAVKTPRRTVGHKAYLGPSSVFDALVAAMEVYG